MFVPFLLSLPSPPFPFSYAISYKYIFINQAGGDKYIVRNILFKFAVDSNGLYCGDYGAMKVAGHELKGIIAYFNVLSDQVNIDKNYFILFWGD